MAQRLNISGSKDTTRKPDLARQKLSAEKMVISPGKQKRLNRMILDAARSGNTKRAERLLKAGASIEAKDSDGWTALMWAAAKGRTQTCAFLLEKGASIEAKDNDGKTALMLAALHGALMWATKNIEEETAAFIKSMEKLQELIGKEKSMEFLSSFRECTQ